MKVGKERENQESSKRFNRRTNTRTDYLRCKPYSHVMFNNIKFFVQFGKKIIAEGYINIFEEKKLVSPFFPQYPVFE